MSRPTNKPSLEAAQAIVSAGVRPVGSESADLSDCLHRVIRRDVISRRAHPPRDSAARDGYCLNAAVTKDASPKHPAVLHICATVRSGDRPRTRIGGRDCARIMTGALLPEGADAVVPFEEAEAVGGYVKVRHVLRPGTQVHRAGGVVGGGGTVARKGDLVGPGLLGLLAAVGVRRLRVSRMVRVGVITTGNEVVGRGTSPRPWEIRDSNSIMLTGLVEELGAEAVTLGNARDSEGQIERMLDAGKTCDLLILTGGSSEGISDHVPAALENHGCRLLIRGMNLRPGKHVVFGRKGNRGFFGLPGRPGGCYGLFHMLVRPAVMAVMGCTCASPAALSAVWGGTVTQRSDVDTLLPARLGPDGEARPVSGKGKGDLHAIAHSNSLALIRAGKGVLRRGDRIEVFPVRLP